MHRSKNNNKNQSRRRGFGTRTELPMRISTSRRITAQGYIYARVGASTYSFTSGSDVRFLSLATMLNTTEFTNMATTWDTYKIMSISVTVLAQPYYNAPVTPSPILYCGFQPEEVTPANPTNLQVIQANTSKRFSAEEIKLQSGHFNLPGTGVATKILLDSNSFPSQGQIVIGNNPAIAFATAIPAFDYVIDIFCKYESPK